MNGTLGPMGRVAPRRVRQDLDVLIVGVGGGRWALTVPVVDGAVEVRGDREEGSRAAALALLRAAGGLGG